MRRNQKIGIVILALAVLAILINHYFLESTVSKIFSLSSAVLAISGIVLIIPYWAIPYYIFDNQEQVENKTFEELVVKMRFRAILFNNISVVTFFFTVMVICLGFYLLVYPQTPSNAAGESFSVDSLTVRIGASVLIIFLVQILFRVFKYLIRVAAFYHAKADAIEFNKIDPKVDLEKIMALLTPDNYDISDVPSPSALDSLVSAIKQK